MKKYSHNYFVCIREKSTAKQLDQIQTKNMNIIADISRVDAVPVNMAQIGFFAVKSFVIITKRLVKHAIAEPINTIKTATFGAKGFTQKKQSLKCIVFEKQKLLKKQ